MITSKQRAYLRGLANTMEPVFQVGKNGIEHNIVMGIKEVLEKRELVKIKVLDTALTDARDIATSIAEELHADIVQVIGSKFVLYKQKSKDPVIDLKNI